MPCIQHVRNIKIVIYSGLCAHKLLSANARLTIVDDQIFAHFFCVYLTVSVFCDDTADKSVFFFVQPFVVVVVVVHSYLQLFVFCPLTRMKLEKQA